MCRAIFSRPFIALDACGELVCNEIVQARGMRERAETLPVPRGEPARRGMRILWSEAERARDRLGNLGKNGARPVETIRTPSQTIRHSRRIMDGFFRYGRRECQPVRERETPEAKKILLLPWP